jgi:hopene-associated glycosyltransferase HpnB
MSALAFASFAAWLYLFMARGGFWRVDCQDGEFYPQPQAWPQVTVVVPARNEADMLSHTLPSLLNHDYPNLHVVLVDDHSEDGTAAVAAKIADENNASARLTVAQSTPMPEGWKGKLWAMQCGFRQTGATGNAPSYVLFTDADIRYDAGVVKRLVARAEAEKRVLTSLMVQLHCKSLAEKFLIPAFVFFFEMLYPFSWVKQGKCAAAAGGCMLVRYDALQNTGGLEPIRSALIDDCALARLMQKQGKLWLGLTEKVHSLRLYPTLQDIRTMVARTAYDQLGYSPFNLAAVTVGMALVFLCPVALALFASGAAHWCGIAAWVLMSIAFIPMLRFYKCPLALCVSLPLVALLYMGFTLDSSWQYSQGRGGAWKGRAQAHGAAA